MSGITGSFHINGNDDEVTAGTGTVIVYVVGNGDTIYGGSGTLVLVGNGSYLAGSGSGNGTLYGSAGSDTLIGGASSGNLLVAGSGNTTLQGGVGSGAVMFGGTGTDTFFGSGKGGDTMVGGTGGNDVAMSGNDIVFGGVGSTDIFTTTASVSQALILEGSGTTNVNLQGGSVTAFAGKGTASYTLYKGDNTQLGIVGFKAGDHLAVSGGFTATDLSNALAGATTGSFGTSLSLSDGTHVTLFGTSLASLKVGNG